MSLLAFSFVDEMIRRIDWMDPRRQFAEYMSISMSEAR